MMIDLTHTTTYADVMNVWRESVLDAYWSCHCSQHCRWCYCSDGSLFDWIERMETVGPPVYSMSYRRNDVEHDETTRRQADWRQLMASVFHWDRSSLHILKSYSIWNEQRTDQRWFESGCVRLVHSAQTTTLTVQAICHWAPDPRSSDVVYHATFVLLDCQYTNRSVACFFVAHYYWDWFGAFLGHDAILFEGK